MIKIETLQTNDFSMDYFKFGTGSKIAAILPGLSIKSVMGSADAIADGYSILKDDFTVFVFDRRKEIPDAYPIRQMADDTAQAMKKLGLKDIYIFGASQGGMIAISIAIENPDLVAKLVLGSTSSHVRENQFEVIKDWISLANRGDREGLYLSFGEKLYPPQVFAQYRDYFINESKTVTDEELSRFSIMAFALKDFNVTDRLKEIKCPVFTIGVYEDAVLDSDATMEIAEQLDWNKHFKLFMYKGYGHAAFDTAPDYRQRIYDFFING